MSVGIELSRSLISNFDICDPGLVISNKSSEAADGNEASTEAAERRIKKLEAEKSELVRKLQEKSNALQELVSQVGWEAFVKGTITYKMLSRGISNQVQVWDDRQGHN